jgi:hypothetical protein
MKEKTFIFIFVPFFHATFDLTIIDFSSKIYLYFCIFLAWSLYFTSLLTIKQLWSNNDFLLQYCEAIITINFLVNQQDKLKREMNYFCFIQRLFSFLREYERR